MSDKLALDRICEILSDREWDADTIDIVAEIVRETGRDLVDPDAIIEALLNELRQAKSTLVGYEISPWLRSQILIVLEALKI